MPSLADSGRGDRNDREKTMSAYLIVDELSVDNPEQLNEYISQAGPLIARAGGELIASGVPEVLEGDWAPKRFVMARFPSMEKLKDWWNSDAYQALLPMRTDVSESNIIIMGGVD